MGKAGKLGETVTLTSAGQDALTKVQAGQLEPRGLA